MRHTLRAHFYSSTTIDFVVCLHSPQTEVCPLCAGCLGDNHRRSHPLYIKTPFLARHDSRQAVCLHSPQARVCPLCSGTLGSLNTTLSVAVYLHSPQTGFYSLHAEVSSWLQPSILLSIASQESSLRPAQLSVLQYVFTVLRLQVCSLCVGACILPGITLSVAVRLCSHQTGVYPLRAGAYPA